MNKFSRQKGFSQIVLLVIISFLAIALPITTKLVQKTQDNRSSAASNCTIGTKKCLSSSSYAECLGDKDFPKLFPGVWSNSKGCPSDKPICEGSGVCTAVVYKKYWVHSSGYGVCSKCTQTSTYYQTKATCGSSCYETQDECVSYYASKYKDYKRFYYFNGSSCVQSECYSSQSVCTSNVGRTCYLGSLDCTNKNSCTSLGGTCKSSCNSNESPNANGKGQCSPNNCCVVSKNVVAPTVSTACSSNDTQKCSSGMLYYCVNGNWNSGPSCGSLGCSSDGVHCNVDGSAHSDDDDDDGSSGDDDPSPYNPTVICTANTVSATECYDSTHLKKCDSTGLAWIQGDQCATGQVCSNGVCGVGATGASKLSFRISFDGVAPGNLSCLDNFKTVTLTVGAVGTTLTQDLTVNITKTTGTGSTTTKGYAIFKAENVALGAGFSGVTNVYARIKGQVHARMYYCLRSQSAKNTSEICNLYLDGTANNFYEYPVLGGDVDQDGVVNSTDFTIIKKALWTTGCGIKSDLNGDAIVNNLDIKIFKVALEAKYDE